MLLFHTLIFTACSALFSVYGVVFTHTAYDITHITRTRILAYFPALSINDSVDHSLS